MIWNEYPYSNVHELNLEWILKKLKEFEDDVAEVNEIAKNWDKQVQALNNRMSLIEAETSRLSSLYDSFVAEVTSKFEQLSSEQIRQFEILTESIDNRFETLENQIQDTLNNFEIRIDYLDNKLDTVLSNLPSLIYMISPFTGEEENIVTIINELASTQRVNSLTAYEYDTLELTAQEYDNYDITAYQYDWNAKEILGGN